VRRAPLGFVTALPVALRPVALLPAALLMVALPMIAAADHGGPFRSPPMSPLVLALLAGGLTLIAGILLVVVITLLRGPAGQDE
jgi:hypothetical protein